MKTYMAKPEAAKKEWFVVDADGVPFGRLASQVAHILRGKHKPTFTPNVDTGDYVIVINSDKAVLTGKKLTQKYFKTYSGYQGGLKETQFKKMMEEKSDVALLRAIKGMLPKNALGRAMAKKVKIYKGATHPHEAQHPTPIKVKGGRD